MLYVIAGNNQEFNTFRREYQLASRRCTYVGDPHCLLGLAHGFYYTLVGTLYVWPKEVREYLHQLLLVKEAVEVVVKGRWQD